MPLISVSQSRSRWMGAVSDVENTEKSAKDASPLRKLFKGKEIEASAIEAFTAKKKLEAQRQELKSFINFHYGANSWNEILRMEAEIRKKRKEEIYAKQELIRKIWEYIGWFVSQSRSQFVPSIKYHSTIHINLSFLCITMQEKI